MQHRALGLQARPQHIQRIDGGGADGATERADRPGGDIADGDVGFVAAVELGAAAGEDRLELLEEEEVDGRVGEHAQEAERQAAVVGEEA